MHARTYSRAVLTSRLISLVHSTHSIAEETEQLLVARAAARAHKRALASRLFEGRRAAAAAAVAAARTVTGRFEFEDARDNVGVGVFGGGVDDVGGGDGDDMEAADARADEVAAEEMWRSNETAEQADARKGKVCSSTLTLLFLSHSLAHSHSPLLVTLTYYTGAKLKTDTVVRNLRRANAIYASFNNIGELG
jgi:hypothetical protein